MIQVHLCCHLSCIACEDGSLCYSIVMIINRASHYDLVPRRRFECTATALFFSCLLFIDSPKLTAVLSVKMSWRLLDIRSPSVWPFIHILLWDEQRVLRKWIVINWLLVAQLIEVNCLVEVRIVCYWGTFIHFLRHLYSNMIKLLHSVQLFHVTFRFLFTVIDVINTSNSIVVQLLSESPHGIVVSLHLYSVLFN